MFFHTGIWRNWIKQSFLDPKRDIFGPIRASQIRQFPAEKVKTCGVSKEKGYLYYLGKDGNVWRSGMSRGGSGGGNAEKVADAGVTRESGYLYFIDKDGDVSRAPMARGRG